MGTDFELIEGCTFITKLQNFDQFFVSSLPNRRPNARGAMFPFAVDAYAEKSVYWPNEEWAPSAWITSWRNGTILLLLAVATKTPVRNRS
jgi:hypothetical protein